MIGALDVLPDSRTTAELLGCRWFRSWSALQIPNATLDYFDKDGKLKTITTHELCANRKVRSHCRCCVRRRHGPALDTLSLPPLIRNVAWA